MNLYYHKNLRLDHWFAQTVSYQMANIGSEISRTINWRNKGRFDYMEVSFERALELLDLTVTDPKNRKRLKELLRSRELLAKWYLDRDTRSDNHWMRYFNTFTHFANRR
ncbi:MAG: hypothetical protein AAB881_01275 [Patescibacteria group bacterium]